MVVYLFLFIVITGFVVIIWLFIYLFFVVITGFLLIVVFFFVSVVNQHYEVQVYRAHVLIGNTAVLSCVIPPYVKDHVSVTSWFRDDSILLPGRADMSEYLLYPIFLCVSTKYLLIKTTMKKKNDNSSESHKNRCEISL